MNECSQNNEEKIHCPYTNCPDWEPDIEVNDDRCHCVDGRWIQAVSEYASTCDDCGELTCHSELAMDPETQLGYCPACVEKAGLPDKYDPDGPWA